MCAAKSREHDRIDALAWKGAVAHAIKALPHSNSQTSSAFQTLGRCPLQGLLYGYLQPMVMYTKMCTNDMHCAKNRQGCLRIISASDGEQE